MDQYEAEHVLHRLRGREDVEPVLDGRVRPQRLVRPVEAVLRLHHRGAQSPREVVSDVGVEHAVVQRPLPPHDEQYRRSRTAEVLGGPVVPMAPVLRQVLRSRGSEVVHELTVVEMGLVLGAHDDDGRRRRRIDGGGGDSRRSVLFRRDDQGDQGQQSRRQCSVRAMESRGFLRLRVGWWCAVVVVVRDGGVPVAHDV